MTHEGVSGQQYKYGTPPSVYDGYLHNVCALSAATWILMCLHGYPVCLHGYPVEVMRSFDVCMYVSECVHETMFTQ
jgi:hypothetical protein